VNPTTARLTLRSRSGVPPCSVCGRTVQRPVVDHRPTRPIATGLALLQGRLVGAGPDRLAVPACGPGTRRGGGGCVLAGGGQCCGLLQILGHLACGGRCAVRLRLPVLTALLVLPVLLVLHVLLVAP